MLYVLLYFVPETLKQETAFMREVSDKYFCDNWVVSTYMGHIVWLPEAWEGYRAAKAAITNTTATADIRRIASGQGNKLRSLVPSLRELLTEGSITQVTVAVKMIRHKRLTLIYVILGLAAGQCYPCPHCGQGEQCHPALAAPPHHAAKVLSSYFQSLELLIYPDSSASVSQHKRTRQLHELARQEARVTSEDLMELLVLVSRLEQLTRSLYTR